MALNNIPPSTQSTLPAAMLSGAIVEFVGDILDCLQCLVNFLINEPLTNMEGLSPNRTYRKTEKDLKLLVHA